MRNDATHFSMVAEEVLSVAQQRIWFGEKQEKQSYIPRTSVYAVIFGSARGQVAALKNERGLYFLPGGGIEPGEDHEACLKRELIEETGYRIRIGPYIGQAEQYHLSFIGEPILGIGHFYRAEMLDKLQESVEKGELTWLGIEQARELLFLQYQAWAVDAALQMP